MTLHGKCVAAGTICLIALAVLLWENECPVDASAVPAPSDFDPPEKRPPWTAPRVVTYNMGHTTITPLVSDAYLARQHLNSGL